MSKIKDMDTYLNEQIKEYNKNLTIIYNSDDLSIDYNVDFSVPPNAKEGADWGYDIILDIYSLYDINSILNKYDADNFAFFINVNKSGCSYAKLRRHGYLDLLNNEFGVMFTSYEDFTKEIAFTHVHETLHLFGAIDLYYPYAPDDERLSLANEYFPN